MNDSMKQFMQLSAALTGYNQAELQATGMQDAYYEVMMSILGGALTGELLSAWLQVHKHAGDDEEALEALLEDKIMGDAKLAPMAGNLISLWYLGQWNQMPGPWRSQYGASARDLSHVVSPEAYREGLVWPTIGSHPMGAKQQGYGAWALPPDGVESNG